MRLALLLAAAAVVIGTAAPASADADNKDKAFLTSLDQAGLTFMNPDRAVSAGKTVCDLEKSGMTGADIVQNLQDRNPGFHGDGAAKFAALAAQSYCPEALTAGEDESPKDNT